MKQKFLQLIMVLMIGAVLLSGCIPTSQEEKTPAPIELTQAALFAQATMTRAALEEEVISYLTQQALPTNTEIPPTATDTVVPPTATSTDTPVPTNTPTATNTEVPPTATNTEVPPTATNTNVPPTATKTSTTVSPPSPIRISFETGATNAFVESWVAAYSMKRFVFWAAEDQLVDVSLQTGDGATLALKSKSGIVLLPASKGEVFYRGYLPASGDYYLDVYASNKNANFGIYLMIPQRLRFERGSYGMDFEDEVKKGSIHNYVVYALKDQTLTVEVEPSSKVYLSIWGKDGTVLLSGMGGLSEFVGVLPSSQDWIINVHAIYGEGYQDYDFMIDIRY